MTYFSSVFCHSGRSHFGKFTVVFIVDPFVRSWNRPSLYARTMIYLFICFILSATDFILESWGRKSEMSNSGIVGSRYSFQNRRATISTFKSLVKVSILPLSESH